MGLAKNEVMVLPPLARRWRWFQMVSDVSKYSDTCVMNPIQQNNARSIAKQHAPLYRTGSFAPDMVILSGHFQGLNERVQNYLFYVWVTCHCTGTVVDVHVSRRCIVYISHLPGYNVFVVWSYVPCIPGLAQQIMSVVAEIHCSQILSNMQISRKS